MSIVGNRLSLLVFGTLFGVAASGQTPAPEDKKPAPPPLQLEFSHVKPDAVVYLSGPHVMAPADDALWVLNRAAGTAAVVFLVLALASKILVAQPVPFRSSWVAAALGAVAVAAVLALGTRLLAVLATKSGPVYGSFATVVGAFALLYLVSQVLLYGAEVAVVREERLWPRALDISRPTPADIRALTRLAVEQERLPAERIEVRFIDDDAPDAQADAVRRLDRERSCKRLDGGDFKIGIVPGHAASGGRG
jgi:hypothetical protein